MVYVVTGANRGIGLKFVEQLAARGEVVYATARKPAEAEALTALAAKHDGKVHVVALDVSDPESVAAFVAALDGVTVDVLVNNAGIYPQSGGIGTLDLEAMRRGFEVNTIAPLRLTEVLLPSLRGSSVKKVMFLSSQMGSIADNGSGGSYAYRMSKTALNMGVRSMSRDLAGDGFITFVVHPGWVQTDMGGPNAKITTEQSVAGMLAVLDSADAQTSGEFMNWNGSKLEW